MRRETTSSRSLSLLAVALIAFGVFLFSNNVMAKPPKDKPGGGNGGGDELTLTGMVYFEDSAYRDPYTIDSAGITAQPLNAWGHPSFLKHSGTRWTIKRFDPWFVYDPKNPPTTEFFLRSNVFVVNESDGSEVLLWFDPDLDVASVEWLPGDESIGCVGRRLDAAGTVTQFGLYFAMVDYDQATGAPTGIIGLPTLVVDYLATGETSDEIPAFSPDLAQVAVKNDASNSLRIYSILSGTMLREIAVADVMGSPHWSPDGTAIVYRAWDGIAVINPDGSSRSIVAAQGGNINSTLKNTTYPRWSPNSSQIVFTFSEYNVKRGTLAKDLHIVNRDGTQNTDLTKGGGPLNQVAMGWRD